MNSRDLQRKARAYRRRLVELSRYQPERWLHGQAREAREAQFRAERLRYRNLLAEVEAQLEASGECPECGGPFVAYPHHPGCARATDAPDLLRQS